MVELIMASGPFGLLVILSTPLLAIANGFVLYSYTLRTATITLVVLNLLPLMFGVTGTAIGYARINQAVNNYEGNVSQETIEEGRYQSRVTTYMGGAGTAFLLVLCGIGTLIRTSDEDSPTTQTLSNEK